MSKFRKYNHKPINKRRENSKEYIPPRKFYCFYKGEFQIHLSPYEY